MGLSAVRVSSCPLKEERASGEDRVEERGETEWAGSVSMQSWAEKERYMYLGWCGPVDEPDTVRM